MASESLETMISYRQLGRNAGLTEWRKGSERRAGICYVKQENLPAGQDLQQTPLSLKQYEMQHREVGIVEKLNGSHTLWARVGPGLPGASMDDRILKQQRPSGST